MKILKVLLMMFLANNLLMASSSAKEIENDADEAIEKFYADVKGSKKYLEKAKAYIVFPDIKEAGFFVGGKYGEGVLRIKGVSKAYYSITSASVGIQMGVQKYSMVIAFTSDASLNKFLIDDDEWDTDVDGKIAVAEWNSKEELDVKLENSMVAFIFNSKGVMGSFTMEGTKFKRIKPE